MKKLVAILFAFVTFLPSVKAQDDEAWKVTDFRSIPTDLDAKVNYPVIDPNGNQCALIKIETGYSGFTFSTGTLQVMKSEKKPGEWWVYVQKGVRKITIGHDRGILRDWQFPEAIKEGNVYVMKLREGTADEAAYTTATATTTATNGFAVITSEPSGADVYIDDVLVGVTPFSNKLYPIGTRLKVRCSKSKYHDDMGFVTITSRRTEQHFILKPAYGTLRLNTEPAGAQVYIGDSPSPRGTTPITVNEVASGSVEVTFKKVHYAPIKHMVVVEDGLTTDFSVPLIPTFAEVTIRTLVGADIFINGDKRGNSMFKGNLDEGPYEIEARMTSHMAAKQSIDVVAGRPVTISLNPTPIFGTLIVTADPFDSEVIVNGKSYGKAPLIQDLLIGEYDIEVRKSGYTTVKEKVVIKEGVSTEINPRLTTGGMVYLTATAAKGSTVYVDDEQVGVYNGTALMRRLSNGTHRVYAINSSGTRSDVMTVNITPGSEKNVNLTFPAPAPVAAVKSSAAMTSTPDRNSAVSPNYVENGKNHGHGIAVLGDWNGNGKMTYLYWAPVNCGYEDNGEIATVLDHRIGKLYQWGAGDSNLKYYYNGSKVVAREMYYDVFISSSRWYGRNIIVDSKTDKWNNNQGPCPEGWRLPTIKEMLTLTAGKNGPYGWTPSGMYAGRAIYPGAEFFGANADKAPGTGVFLPATGYRDSVDGKADLRNYGYYWTSTLGDNRTDVALSLNFNASQLTKGFDYRATGAAVRCVSEGVDSERNVQQQSSAKSSSTGSSAKSNSNAPKVMVTIKSIAGARIFIDGEERGESTFKGPLTEGSHNVEVRLAGYDSIKKTIDVDPVMPSTYVLNPETNKVSYTQTTTKTQTPHTSSQNLTDKTFTVNGVKFKMVFVQGGTFQMGATSEQGSDAYDDEKPVHSVTLSNYMIGQTEVTQELWEAVMGNNPSRYKGAKNPVERVSWNNCQAFIKRLNSMTGLNFRLPTEAEWEYAARGGNKSRGYKFSGSNNCDDVAWWYGEIHPVATKMLNELWLYDMSGNVWEWCQDWYGSYNSNNQINPQGPNSGIARVYRGGGGRDGVRSCRSSCRNYFAPNLKSFYLGLRLVLDISSSNTIF